MKTCKWTQTIIQFEEYYKSKLEIEYHKTYKSLERFYTLSIFNNLVIRKLNFNKWFSNYKIIQRRIDKKEAVHRYMRKLWIGL